MVKVKHLALGLVFALAPFAAASEKATSVAVARSYHCDQCPVPDHDALNDCYDRCDWALAGDLVFCQVATPDVVSRTVCQSIAHNSWGNCYRKCRG